MVVAGLLLGGRASRPGQGAQPRPARSARAASGDGRARRRCRRRTPTPEPTPVPTPGHEVYGYLPYWEMTDGIADHLARVELTTLALFSVTNRPRRRDRHEPEGLPGDRRGARPAAHPRGPRPRTSGSSSCSRSFGATRNKRLFGVTQQSRRPRRRSIDRLVELAGELKVDGINVDVEVIDDALIPAYGEFVGELRTALRQGAPEGPGLGRDHGQRARLGDGARRLDGRCRPDLPDGLRLPLVGIRPGRLGADRSARRRREGPGLVARHVRGARRPGPADDPRPAAVRDGLAGRRTRARRAADREGDATGSPSDHLDFLADPANVRDPRRHRAGRPVRHRPTRRPSATAGPERLAARLDGDLRRFAGDPRRRSWPWPTPAAWPASASGRSATTAACPTTPP